MASQGSTLQTTNSQLVSCIEELRQQKEDLNRQIAIQLDEKRKIENNLRILNEKMSRIEDGLARKHQASHEYAKTLQETEAAYHKILSSSNTLLSVVKRETTAMEEKYRSIV